MQQVRYNDVLVLAKASLKPDSGGDNYLVVKGVVLDARLQRKLDAVRRVPLDASAEVDSSITSAEAQLLKDLIGQLNGA